MAGSAICRALEKNGYGSKESGGSLLKPTRQELNLTDTLSVRNWFENNKPDVCIIAAAKVGGIIANSTYPADFLLENLKIQNNLIEGAWKSGVRRILFLGSSCIYPKHAMQPIKEESLLTGPLETTNECYAIAKIAGIKLCESLRKQYGVDAINLMPTNLYGPGDNYSLNNSHVMPGLIRRFYEAAKTKENRVMCWGSGNPLREFLHVDDLGEACVFALEKWKIEDDATNIMNVGTGKDVSIRQLAEKIAKEMEYKGEIIWDATKPDGAPKKQLDVSLIQAMGWKAKIPLDEGIKKTIENYKKNIVLNQIRN